MSVAVASIDVLAEAQSTTITLTKPANTASGDLLLVHIQTRNDGGGTPTGNSINSVPSGWTLGRFQKGTGGVVYQTAQYYYKVAGGSEPSTYDFGLEGNYYFRASIWRITGARTVSPIGTDNSDFVNNTSTPSLATTITPNANSLIIQLWGGIDGANSSGSYAIATNNPTWTEGYSATLTAGGAVTGRFVSAYAVRSQSTATGNMSLSGGGASSDWAGILLAIPPLISASVSDTTTVTDSVSLLKITYLTASDTSTVTDSQSEVKSKKWTNDSKNTSSWVNDTKH